MHKFRIKFHGADQNLRGLHLDSQPNVFLKERKEDKE